MINCFINLFNSCFKLATGQVEVLGKTIFKLIEVILKVSNIDIFDSLPTTTQPYTQASS